MKRNAFTLVELLAVIGILAVILTITIPIIGNYIKDKKKDSFFISAKNILRHVEAEGLYDNEINARLNMLNLTDLKEENYDIEGSYVYTKDGELHLTLKGKGKFKGLYICGLTSSIKENNVVETECSEDSFKANLADYITRLYNNEETRIRDGLKKDNTPDQNIRYYGSNPNNYVSFNNELWRIIGVFGNNVKLIRSEKLGDLSWDSSESSVNNGYGVNEWSQADLKNYLNTMYYGGTSVTCYNGENNQTKTCPTNTLDETSKSLIDNHTWNTGAIDKTDTTIVNPETFAINTVPFYNAERGNVTGKICNGGGGCNDTVERATTWPGYVGLPYVTDWAYASSERDCETNMFAGDIDFDKQIFNMTCKKNNWMHHGTTTDIEDATWFMSPFASPVDARYVCFVNGDGNSGGSDAANRLSAFPTIYLKSNILIESGTGTSSNPYILKAGS